MIKIDNKTIFIKKGNITDEISDAIVNPANGTLQHGGGAALSIVKAGGLKIQDDSNKLISKLGILPTSKAVITYAYKLPCKFIIHTVGPHMGEGNEDYKLNLAIINTLNLANIYNLKSLSIPAISSGIFRFPKKRCAHILIKNSIEFLKNKDTTLENIIMCNNDSETYNIFLEEERNFILKKEVI